MPINPSLASRGGRRLATRPTMNVWVRQVPGWTARHAGTASLAHAQVVDSPIQRKVRK